MRIAAVKTVHLVYRYPKGQIWKWSGGYFDSWSSVFVQVIADDGRTGRGVTLSKDVVRRYRAAGTELAGLVFELK
jgi:hypothetical protein